MIDRVRSFFKKKIVQDIAKLSLGTLAGRIIVVAVMPLLTRLYSPADFAMLAVYLSIVATISTVVCLRLEIPIPIVESDKSAAGLLVLSAITMVTITILLIIVVLLFGPNLAALLDLPGIEPYLWLVPLGVLLSGSYSLMQFWSTRFRRFGLIARTSVSQAFVGVAVMLGGGWLGLAPLGLLVGKSLTVGAGSGVLAVQAFSKDRALFYGLRIRELVGIFKKNSSYPKYSTVEAFANIAGYQLPIILIASLAGDEAGQLFLALQVMAVPMTLLGGSISKVYLSRAPERAAAGGLASFTYGMMLKLTGVGSLALISIGIVSPSVFTLVFGEGWLRAGEIVRILIPWMVLQFAVSPVSMVLHVVGQQKQAMLLQCAGLLIRYGGLLAYVNYGGGYVVEAHAALSASFYLLYVAAVCYAMRKNGKRNAESSRPSSG